MRSSEEDAAQRGVTEDRGEGRLQAARTPKQIMRGADNSSQSNCWLSPDARMPELPKSTGRAYLHVEHTCARAHQAAAAALASVAVHQNAAARVERFVDEGAGLCGRSIAAVGVPCEGGQVWRRMWGLFTIS